MVFLISGKFVTDEDADFTGSDLERALEDTIKSYLRAHGCEASEIDVVLSEA